MTISLKSAYSPLQFLQQYFTTVNLLLAFSNSSLVFLSLTQGMSIGILRNSRLLSMLTSLKPLSRSKVFTCNRIYFTYNIYTNTPSIIELIHLKNGMNTSINKDNNDTQLKNSHIEKLLLLSFTIPSINIFSILAPSVMNTGNKFISPMLRLRNPSQPKNWLSQLMMANKILSSILSLFNSIFSPSTQTPK